MSLSALYLLLAVSLLIYMSLWYGVANYLKRIDVIDTAWGLGFVYVALLSFFSYPGYPAVNRLTVILVGVWGLRLAAHITKRNLKKPEDPRYAVYRSQWGSDFARKAFTNIYLLQGLLILLVSTPIIAIEQNGHVRWIWLAVIGFLVWIFGILTEAVADYQLRQFLSSGKGDVMQAGLWRYSRHPNYFGEITTWVGAGLVAVSVGRWWGLLGPLTIGFLIVKISGIPPLEKRYAHDKIYQAYAKRTSVLIPLPPKS